MRRVKRAWIPTSLVTASSAIRVVVPEPPARGRAWEISRRFLGVLWALLCRRPAADVGLLVKHQLEALGGLWIKVGQFLSLRLDLFPEDFCHVLTHLTSRAPGFPGTHARAILEQQLGRPVEEVFEDFETQPLHAASLGQIHKARLRREQAWVAVKVRTPYADESFLSDLRFLALLAYWASWLYPRGRFPEGVAELKRALLEELDFRYEANGMRQMRKTLHRHGGIYVPKLFSRYSTDRVLVTEWIAGVGLSDLLSQSKAQILAWCRQNGFRVKRWVEGLLRSVFRQIFEDNRYHGDLHPGNILLLKDNRCALLDYGMTSATEVEFLTRFRELVGAVVTQQYAKAAQFVCLLSAALPTRTALLWEMVGIHNDRLERLQRTLTQTMQDWTTRAEIASLDYHQKSLNGLTTLLMQAVMTFKGAMQWAWLRISRTLATLDGSIATLHPTINYRAVVLRYFEDAAARLRVKPSDVLMRLAYRLPDLELLLDATLEFLRLHGAQERQRAFPTQGR